MEASTEKLLEMAKKARAPESRTRQPQLRILLNILLIRKKACLQSNGLHFVGIGGTGMNGIAEVLLNLGYEGPDRI